MDKYSVEVPGITVDEPTKNSWLDKYLVDKPQNIKSNEQVRKERFERGQRLGRDVGNSILLQAISGPGTLINMGGQGLYGAGSHLYDVAKEKGVSNINAEDLKQAGVSGGISALGPLAGRFISPTVPLQPKGPIEGISHWVAKNKGMQYVPDEFLEEIARAGRSDIFKPFAKELTDPTAPSKWVKAAQAVSNNAMPAMFGGILGHTIMDSPVMGALAGMGLTHAKDIVSKGIPNWYHNMWMHTGKYGPAAQSVLNQLAREGGSEAADIIRY